MDEKDVIEAQHALRDEAVLLVLRSGGVRRRLRSRWAYIRDLHADIEQDVYLELLWMWERVDKRPIVQECLESRQRLAAVVDFVVKAALVKYGRDVREVEEATDEWIPYNDLAADVAHLAQYLPTKERRVYEQWIECRYNCQTLANMHGVSKSWMSNYIGKLNQKIRLLWERLF